jgi:hypothetical protein
LNKFLIFYNFNRGHGGLRKEIEVRTPYEALEYWYNLKPDLFIRKPDMFRFLKDNILNNFCIKVK